MNSGDISVPRDFFSRERRSDLIIGGCFAVDYGMSRHIVNAFSVAHRSIHVVVRCTLKIFLDSFRQCEGLRGYRFSDHEFLAVDGARICISRCWIKVSRHVARALTLELEVDSDGPRSIILTAIQAQVPDPGSIFTFQRLASKLGGRSVVLHFVGCDDLLEPGAYPSASDMLAHHKSRFNASKCLKFLFRGLADQVCLLKEFSIGVGVVFDWFSLNMRKLWGKARVPRCFDISGSYHYFGVQDVVLNLQRWGQFSDRCHDTLVKQLVWFSGPPEIYQSLVKQLEILHISSFSQMHARFPEYIAAVRCELRDHYCGLKYMSKSAAILCILMHNCEFASNEWFDERLMRLVRGGITSFRLDRIRNRYYVAPMHSLLLEQMAIRLNTSIEVLNSIIAHVPPTPATNSASMWQQLLILEILGVSSQTSWKLFEDHGLISMFGINPSISGVKHLHQDLAIWASGMKANILYVFGEPVDSLTQWGYAFVASFRGNPTTILLCLEERLEDHDCSQLLFTISADYVRDLPVVRIFASFPKDTAISPVVGLGSDSIRADDSTRSTFYTSAVFHRICEYLRVKIPWWDTSKRYRTYDTYMSRRLMDEIASARMATKQHKATALTYSHSVMQQRNASALGMSLEEFELYRKQSELYRVKAGIPHILSVVSVRLLVRHLLEWGTQLTEAIEVRRILKRSRVYLLTLTSLPTEILKSSKLALGTRMALMAIVDAVNNRTVAY